MLLDLARTVRFCVNAAPPAADGALNPGEGEAGRNGYSAYPAMAGFGRFFEIEVLCRGSADPTTGFFLNIKEIDQAVRAGALPRVAKLAQTSGGNAPLASVLRELTAGVREGLGERMRTVRWAVTPYYSLTMEGADMSQVLVRQRYEFSAAHRLHASNLSDAENVRIFGKCNNPAGHGHNYHLEVTVRARVEESGQSLEISALDAAVERAVLSKVDHKHLNEDVAAFKHLNPTVENIAVTLHGWLREEVAALGATLEEVAVWETEKTVCRYRGE